eukprot:376555_1
MCELLTVKCTTANVVNRPSRPYAVYEMHVDSSVTNAWIVYKRVNDFHNLGAGLQKELNTNIELREQNIQIPCFPSRWLRSVNSHILQRRQIQFKHYINTLLKNDYIRCHCLIFSFLEVPDELRKELMKPLRCKNEKIIYGYIRMFASSNMPIDIIKSVLPFYTQFC